MPAREFLQSMAQDIDRLALVGESLLLLFLP
jgi:hypothetical protein